MGSRGPKAKQKPLTPEVRYGKCKECGVTAAISYGKVCRACQIELNDDIREAVTRFKSLPLAQQIVRIRRRKAL